MPRIAANADEYAAKRIGIFFPANNQTPDDGNLTGQCVTLNKWFLAEMTNVPAPFSARGDARLVGRTLVNQGHAVEVPWDQRRRGDFICYEYGTYGHIAVQLSGGRVFEQNVNMPGTTRRLVDGDYVYSSRVGSENESWRVGKNPHVYRIKSYNEEGEDIVKPTEAQVYDSFRRFAGMEPSSPEQVKYYMGRDIRDLYSDLLNYEVVPKKAVVEQAFKDFQPWLPINTPPYTDQTTYYMNKPVKILLTDLAVGLKKRLAEAEKNQPAPADEFVEYNGSKLYIKKEQ